jgi:hypothetical protein
VTSLSKQPTTVVKLIHGESHPRHRTRKWRLVIRMEGPRATRTASRIRLAHDSQRTGPTVPLRNPTAVTPQNRGLFRYSRDISRFAFATVSAMMAVRASWLSGFEVLEWCRKSMERCLGEWKVVFVLFSLQCQGRMKSGSSRYATVALGLQ